MKFNYTTDEGETREVEIPILDLNWEYERSFLNLVPCPVKGYPDVLHGNFKYNEDECEHQSITEYYEGYQCNECGKWFTYDEDVTGIHKQRLQERIEIYRKHKEFDAEFRKVKQKISEKKRGGGSKNE